MGPGRETFLEQARRFYDMRNERNSMLRSGLPPGDWTTSHELHVSRRFLYRIHASRALCANVVALYNPCGQT